MDIIAIRKWHKHENINVSDIQNSFPVPSSANVQTRQWDVTLDKEGPGYGFTLRGGMKVESMKAHPLTVVAVRPGSPADRDGHIKVGDRVIQVNGYKVTHLTLAEMWGLLQHCGSQTIFTVAYDVAIMGKCLGTDSVSLLDISKIDYCLIAFVKDVLTAVQIFKGNVIEQHN